jgi:hypothetical protein
MNGIPEFRISAAGKSLASFSACVGDRDEVHQDPYKSGQKYMSLAFREAEQQAAAKPKSAAWVVEDDSIPF